MRTEKAEKPYLTGDGYYNGVIVYDTAYCPNCNRAIEIECEELYKYCPTCGQKLDWSDIDNEN